MYFHVSEQVHSQGTILVPGRFGDAIRTFKWPFFATDASLFRTALAELTLETARQAIASNSPSRLNCIFVAESLEFGRKFRDIYRPNGRIYSVKPVGETLLSHRGNFELISRPRDGTLHTATTYRPKQSNIGPIRLRMMGCQSCFIRGAYA